MHQFSHLQIRTPKDDETAIEAASQIFSSLLPSHIPFWKQVLWHPKTYSFEIYLLAQTIYFYVTTPTQSEILVRSLLTPTYPKSKIQKTTDPMISIFRAKSVSVGEMVLGGPYYLPIKTYSDFSEIDPMSSILGFLSKQDPSIKMAIQILITPAEFPWQNHALAASNAQVYDSKTQTYKSTNENKSLIVKKAAFQGGRVGIRMVASSSTANINTLPYLRNLAGTFGSFAHGEGNRFGFKRPIFTKGRLINRIKTRSMGHFERTHQILNAQELATLWHPPGLALAGIKNLAWGKTLSGEPPENLPVADNTPDDTKKDVNFFAKTEYKNKDSIFGIKTPDRRKHVYVIGKTGAGKSTLIANMAIDDIRKDRGIGVIDPHGDLCETIIDFIPKRRLNDVVYLEPFDTDRPFSLNVLEVHNKQQKDLVASGIVSIFYKLYKDSWGPRLEYILRNVIMTLLETPGSTLVDILALLADERYRRRVVGQLQDPVLKNFWEREFAMMPDRLKSEAISPIQNKVGQFVTSRMIRNILGSPKSSINLEEIMNGGKILLLNLSQGKLGEDSAALLGAMMITQIQLAAMNRSFMKEEERKDFFLYVDEFQNFATSSFVKILSEARKYRLALTLANQYIEQLDEEVSRAIFGNVGTLMSFVVGARDAHILTKEYAAIYSENDLVSLGKHEAVLKLCIDNMTSMPFPAKTLPLPSLRNDNRDKIIRLSKERYGRKIEALPPPTHMIEPSTEHPQEPAPQEVIPQPTQLEPQQPSKPAQQNPPAQPKQKKHPHPKGPAPAHKQHQTSHAPNIPQQKHASPPPIKNEQEQN